ncbi:MAG: hypothetical protein IIW94_05015 [Clostridia bacterium]|nr:hypothetical protein [Clostridia bacterium]
MKITAKRLLSILLAFALVATMFSGGLLNIASASPVNLLNNGGFEDFSEGNFTGWALWKGNHGNTDIAQVDGRTDKAAKISVNDNSSIANFSQAITPEAEGEYTLSAYIKIENIVRQWETAPGVYLSIRNTDAGNAKVLESSAINVNTDWQKIELTVDASALPAANLAFDLTIEYVMGDIYIDDAVFSKVEPEQTPEELLKNNGLEEFAEGNFKDWTLWKGNHGNTDIAQVEGRTNKAAKISVNDNSSIANFSQAITPEAEGEYTLTAWVKIENIVRQWETAPGVYLSIRNTDAGNAKVAESSAINVDTDWQKIELTVDASALPTANLAFDVTIEYVKGDIYLDDLSFKKKVAEPTPPAPADPDELLGNNGFEEFITGSFTNWTFWPGNHGNSTIAQVDGRTAKAAKISVHDNSSVANLSQAITPEAEGEYTLSAYIKIENIVRQWETAPGVYLSIRNTDAGNAKVAESSAINVNTDWQKIEFTVDASALPTANLAFDLTIEYVMGDIYVDDVSFKKNETTPTPPPTEPPTNPDEDQEDTAPLKNTDFETFENGSFTNWTLWPGNQGNTTIAQADGRTGKAAKITIDNNNNIVNLYQSVTLEADKTYKLSVWVKTENIALQWDAAPGVYLALSYNNNIVLAKSSSIKTDSDWTELTLTVKGSVLSGNETSVQLDVVSEYFTGNVYIDDASITETTEQPAPGPGDEPPTTPEEDTAPLKNSGFEKFENGNFNHWTFWKGNKGNTQLAQADGKDGKAAKFVIDNDENIVRLYQEVKLDPTLEYTFSVWVKTENTALQWPSAPGVYVNLALDNAKVLASESINKDSDWQQLKVVINGAVLTGKEWSVCFDIAAEYIKGNIYIDNATLEVTGKATPIAQPDEDEMLKNNSFEIYSAGNFANWTAWKGNKGNTKFEQVDGRTGKGVKITVDNNNNIVNLYQELKLEKDKEYTFSVWVKTENIKLQWPGAQGVYLNFKYNNNVILMSKPVTADSGWQKLELKVNGGILQGNEWGVSLDIAAEFLTGTIYVDDASVKVTGKGTPVPAEHPDEKLQNSSFELYSGYNFARWSLNKGNKGNTQLSQVSGKTGKAAKIVIDDNNNIVSLYQGITLDPKKEYTFSVWIKAENIELQWAGAEGIYLALGYNNTTPVRSKAIKEDTGWQKLEVKVGGGDLKGDEWGIQFAIMAEFLTGTIYVDDASMRITGDYVPKPDSLLENSGFDAADEDTIIAGWSAYAEDLFSVLDRNTDKTKDSIASASIFNSDNKTVSYWEQALENLDTKKDYLLSGFIFSDMIVSEDGGAAVFVEFYDPDGHLIRTYRTAYVTGEQTDWTSFEMKLSFPENCTKMVVKAALTKAVGTAYFDEFTLTEFDDTVHTAEEGIFENMYFMGIPEDETSVSGDANVIPVFVWFIVAGAVVLITAAVVVFIVLRKKKTVIKI